MKKIIFKPKPLSKAERSYLLALAKRPSQASFQVLFSKINNNLGKQQ